MCINGFIKSGFKEPTAFGLGGGELRFQPVTHGLELFDFGDDAVLFGEGRMGSGQLRN